MNKSLTPEQQSIGEAFKKISEGKYQDVIATFEGKADAPNFELQASALKTANLTRDTVYMSKDEVRPPDSFSESCAFMSTMIKNNDYPALLGHMSDQIKRASQYYEIPQKMAAAFKATCYVLKAAATTTLDFLADPKGTIIKGFENLAKTFEEPNVLTNNIAKMCQSFSYILQNIDKPMNRVKETLYSSCEKISAMAFGQGKTFEAAMAK